MRGMYFKDFLKEQLKDPEFKKEWDRTEPQYKIIEEIIKYKIKTKNSEKELAKKAKTSKAVISRIEHMTLSPSIDLVQRIAEAMGKKLEIKFT